MADFKLVKAIVKGLLTFIPGINSLLDKRKSKSVHSCSDAEFCYTLWLSLLVYLRENKIDASLKNIGEIGNGGSLGVGFCALLTGSQTYYSLQINDKINIRKNQKLLEEIITLFKNRTPISQKYYQINIKIKDHAFPEDLIFTAFSEDQVLRLREEINNELFQSKLIRIINKWENSPPLGLNFIFSRAVMEHVRNPYEVYKAIKFHLNDSSYMMHDIELHSHGITNKTDGHFQISSLIWSIVYGKRSYFLNRWDLPEHITAINELNFGIIKMDQTCLNNKEDKTAVIYGATILARLY
jgi:hypothetical protein